MATTAAIESLWDSSKALELACLANSSYVTSTPYRHAQHTGKKLTEPCLLSICGSRRALEPPA